MATRQPIVSVLGHVDHGKTSLLDRIRGTSVTKREAGLITQHIGATEVPIDHIYKVTKPLIGASRKFNVPGLLFIDTPGHQSFTSLRARGGALADLAVLVIDVNEGLKPQTLESIQLLKRFKTPFIIAMNKIDLIEGWQSKAGAPFVLNYKAQTDQVKAKLDDKMYKIIGDLYEKGFSVDRYDRIEDFTKAIAVVPMSARNGEGLPDLLLVLIGLAQRFLEAQLKTEEGPAQGTILEVKEEKGIGPTLDVIIFAGTLRRGDTIILGTKGKPVTTKVKAILRPKPLDEIRDPKDRFDSVTEVSAAIGVKLLCQNIEGVVSGAPLRATGDDMAKALEEVAEETRMNIQTSEEGVYIKADALGSLEALAFECEKAGIPVRKYDTGMISRKDLIDTAAYGQTFHRVILAFGVDLLPEAKEALPNYNLKVFASDVVRCAPSSPSPARSSCCPTACSARPSRPSWASGCWAAAFARGRRC
jgi:translation initiation factor 5B